jgi:anti-sigma regulatory factor (Ser/Thr protein kinase)
VIELARMQLQPELCMVRVITAGMGALFEATGMEPTESGKLQMAAEEVFVYCVRSMADQRFRTPITVRLSHDHGMARVSIEHCGPHGPLDRYFKRNAADTHYKCTSPEGMGMRLARETVDALTYDYWAPEKTHRFCINYQWK